MKLKLQLLGVILMSMISVSLMAQNTVTGKIIDANSAELLIGANIMIQGTSTGASTDLDGNFSLTSDQSFPWILEISYTGYTDQTIDVASAISSLAIKLRSGITFQDEVVISASRKREKVTESVASVSALSSARLQSMSLETSPENLVKNIQGVRIVDNGVFKKNIALRGQALANETNTLVLKDYRPINNPYTTIIETQLSPLSNLDIERVEVVRGPSGALWGPGVNSGVVHFISKDPFRYPGTGISVNRSVEGQGVTKIDFRHAASNNKFGYKILFSRKTGDDFIYDLNNPEELEFAQSSIASVGPPGNPLRDGIFDDPRGNQLEYGNNLIPNVQSTVAELTLEYKVSDDFKIALVPSIGEAQINFRNAANHLRDHSAFFDTQLRVNYKNFFASVNYFHQPGWDGDLNNTFSTVSGTYPVGTLDNFGQLNAFDLATQLPVTVNEKLDFVFGVDAKINKFVGDYNNGDIFLPSRHGRYENDDDFNTLGGYFQATYKINPKFKVNAVARLDNYTIYGSAFSPRVGFVFNPDEEKNHAIRGSINRSFRAVSMIETNFDVKLGPSDVLGTRTTITFDDGYVDWAFDNNANPSLQSIIAGLANGLSTEAQAELAGIALSGNATTNLMDPFLGVPWASTDEARVEPAELESATSFELGYSGTSSDKRLNYSIDAYYQIAENMKISFTDLGPLVNFNDLSGELTAALPGVSSGTIAELVAAAPVNSRMVSDQHVEVGAFNAISSGFRNYEGKANMFGIDLSIKYSYDNGLSPFLNYSWINDVVFDTEELGERPETGRQYWLNTSPSRVRFGLNKIVTKETGFYGNITGRYDAGFFATEGSWSGDVASYFMVDASVGYQFSNGINIGISGTNLTDVAYRALPRIPAQGRLVFLNITYDLVHNLLDK